MPFLSNTQGYVLSQNCNLLLSTRKTSAIPSFEKFCDKFVRFQKDKNRKQHIT